MGRCEHAAYTAKPPPTGCTSAAERARRDVIAANDVQVNQLTSTSGAVVLELLIGAIIGAIFGIAFTALFQRRVDRLVLRLSRGASKMPLLKRLHERRRRITGFKFLTDNYEAMGLFTLMVWSPHRPLLRQLHALTAGEAPAQTWFDDDQLTRAQTERSRHLRGNTAYAFDMTIDHREYEGADRFILSVAESSYGDLNAIHDCFERNATGPISGTEQIEWVKRKIDRMDSSAILRSMPATRLSIEVALISREGRAIAVRRSHAVASVAGIWALGFNETLVPFRVVTPQAAPDSLFLLAERCLREECAIAEHDLGPIHITWFGLGVNTEEGVSQNVLAVVATRLPETEIAMRLRQAHSSYESDAIDWVGLNPRELDVLFEKEGRRWLAHSRLAARELLNFRELLEDDLLKLRTL